jgi:adenine deaminase
MPDPALIAVARGDAPADLLLLNARIVNVLNGKTERGNVAITGGRIAGIGDYSEAREIFDLHGEYLAPGLIDGHTHIESSLLHPARYAEAVVPHGTLTLVTDLHEIANVCGLEGIGFVDRWSRRLPLDMFFMAPSCVPATHMETSGAVLDAAALKGLRRNHRVIGLGEMMNYPGVVFGDPAVLAKLEAFRDRVRDGHAPGLGGHRLNAYAAAGIGSDHECTTLTEAREKLARGMHIMIREGSSEKNLEALLPIVNDSTWPRCILVVDDRSCADLLAEGDIDAVVRKAIRLGLDPVRALQLATLNPARYFRLWDRGAVAPGYLADLITFHNLKTLEIDRVFRRGKLVARAGKMVGRSTRSLPRELSDTVRVKPFGAEALAFHASSDKLPVIEVIPGQIVTRKATMKVGVRDGVAQADSTRDILKIVVVERHHATGNIGVGFIKGFGLKKGALASSVAHDSHNIVAVGVSDADILGAVNEVVRMGGGLVAWADGHPQAVLPLEIAGLLSSEPLSGVVDAFKKVEKAASTLGQLPQAPFALLSFMALPVIPELKLTDRGLVDVGEFKIIKI